MIVAFIPVEWVERALFHNLVVVSRPVRIERRETTTRRIIQDRRDRKAA